MDICTGCYFSRIWTALPKFLARRLQRYLSSPKLPCNPIPPKFRGAISPPEFWRWSVRNPLFYNVFCNRGKKSIHHHRGTPLFSVCHPTWRSQSKKSYGVYHFPGKTREKGIHHRSGKKGIHHRASDPENKKKEGLHGGGVYFFLP